MNVNKKISNKSKSGSPNIKKEDKPKSIKTFAIAKRYQRQSFDLPDTMGSRNVRGMAISPIVHAEFIKEVVEGKKNVFRVQQTWSHILREYVGKTALIYNGKNYSKKLVITSDVVGYRFGQFILTRKKANHNMEKKK